LIFVKNGSTLILATVIIAYFGGGEMPSKNILVNLATLIIAILLLNIPLFSQDTTNSVIDVSNITSWIRDDGFHPALVTAGDVAGGNWNGTFPKGTAGSIYTEGVVWGGLVNDSANPLVRVGGSTYFPGNFPLTRLYRVRPYFDKIDLRDDASSTFRVRVDQVTDSMIAQVYNQYKKNWNGWPGDKGAPFNDINKNGIYEPTIDVPGIPGASQTIWISYDDRNSITAYGSPPAGLEVQETYWAYSDDSTQSNVIYKNVKIIYKGLSTSQQGSRIDSMYVAEFSDVDDGGYTDDYVGCDTSLNLGYVYNSRDSDQYYSHFSLAPPAVGYTFLQGVAEKTGNMSDSAIVNFKWRKGYKFFNSVPMTGYIPFTDGSYYSDPAGQSYTGTLQYYNLMRGYAPQPQYPANDPFLDQYGKPIKNRNVYIYSGDPVTKTGWNDGSDAGPGSRRMDLVSGPFYLNLGDTAEVTMALVGGVGLDNISCISNLRYNARYAIASYNYFVQQMTEGQNISAKFPQQAQNNLPGHYILSQNYPNPFNPTTTVEYNLPKDAFVKLVVYDILGREIKTLVDENKAAGSYKVLFDSSNLPSGVYFCRITFTNSDSKLSNDNLSKVIKMMLLK
jgi:hypothetical protein